MNNVEKIFKTHGKIITFKANDVVFNENDICNSVGYIIYGKVKISTFSSNESEVVLNLLKEGSLFGDLLVFSSNARYYGMGICLEKTSIAFLSKDSLLSLFSLDNLFLTNFLKIITNKGIELKQKNKLFAHKNIEERVTYYLNHVAKKVNDTTVSYKSVTDMANLLSIPRPSLSRTLHNMERKGKIVINKNEIILKK